MAFSEERSAIEQAIQEVAKIVTEMAGIQLGSKQYPMIENRLKTRMMKLQIENFAKYLDYLKRHREAESQALLSLMTTHHTYFFREFGHFEFLLNQGVPRLIEMARSRPDKTIRVLSAACSRGQESYSLAMFFDFHLKVAAPDLKFEIWGTDVDPESVRYAQNGVYRADELKQSPAMYINGHWVRGTGEVRDFTKAKMQLKSHCHFTTGNLLSYDSFLIGKKFDIIFCRNVFIYFNSNQIKSITEKLLGSLDDQGFLFLGVSETLNGLQLKVDSVGPSIYQKKSATKNTPAKAVVKDSAPKILEVLCVDDSPVIHALLKKILIREHGFQITSTASNGREALNILKDKKFDVITLDLHMPELDGVGFLSEYKNRETPVLVISSVNRDDTSIAQKAISLGAKDYVEKPSLENLAQAGNEIRAKLKMILGTKTQNTSSGSSVVKQEKKPSIVKKHKVLIVDDSQTIRTLIKAILNRDSRFEVVGEIEKPSLVSQAIEKLKPDVITLDIHMPEMNGVELLRKIHPKYKIPTLMISSISREEGSFVLDALSAGAVDYIQKPSANQIADLSRELCERVAAAAQVQIKTAVLRSRKMKSDQNVNLDSLVVVGSSTGGTEAVRVMLEGMPSQIPPILIVQHIPPVFSAAFADRLNSLFPFEVKEACHGDEVKKNTVFIAPGGKQMGVKQIGEKLLIQISDSAAVNRHKPSVDYLFQSVAQARLKNIVAVVLTGMGADGATQLKTLRDQGAHTIAQDEATSVVYGMPREAFERGGAEVVLPLGDIASRILSFGLNTQKNLQKKVS